MLIWVLGWICEMLWNLQVFVFCGVWGVCEMLWNLEFGVFCGFGDV